jgi:hypothetical protein
MNAERAIEDGTARRFDVDGGYLVLQKWGDELFVLFIQMAALNYPAMLHALKSLARREGCTRIAGIGRRGWDRKLARYGFAADGDGGLQLTLEA